MKTQIYANSFYHIYNRGVEKRRVFLGGSDYERFLTLLYLCNSRLPVDLKLQGNTLRDATTINRGALIVEIGAYCLMPNHFHLLVRSSTENSVSTFMQKLTTAYTMYFNKKAERNGALFQGTYKAQHADDDNYLKYLISYIHLNPVKLTDPLWKERGITDASRTKAFLTTYRYSSYLDFLGKSRQEKILLAENCLPKYFDSPTDFEATIKDWLEYNANYANYKV